MEAQGLNEESTIRHCHIAPESGGVFDFGSVQAIGKLDANKQEQSSKPSAFDRLLHFVEDAERSSKQFQDKFLVALTGDSDHDRARDERLEKLEKKMDENFAAIMPSWRFFRPESLVLAVAMAAPVTKPSRC